MEIALLYLPGCPNWQETYRRLQLVIDDLGLDLVPHLVRVDGPDDAERYGFRGSPTVLVDGVDPLADAELPVGLACGVYSTAHGPAGPPTCPS